MAGRTATPGCGYHRRAAEAPGTFGRSAEEAAAYGLRRERRIARSATSAAPRRQRAVPAAHRSFAHFLDDPYTPRVEREPLFDEVTSPSSAAASPASPPVPGSSRPASTDVRIIEGGGDVGGAWYWNRYPGAMCDTAAMVYLPLLEETGHMPSMKYVYAPEIFGHAKRIATTSASTTTRCSPPRSPSWSGTTPASRWIIHTDRGDAIRARFVTMGTGPLHRPKLPGIPGIETFGGHAFHTSRWDYDYTGGDPEGAPMANLADKRVGIIGTGATAVQCIPRWPATRASCSSSSARRRRSMCATTTPSTPSGSPRWARAGSSEWLTNFATLQTGGFADEDLVKDGWTDISKRIRDRVVKMVDRGRRVRPRDDAARVRGERRREDGGDPRPGRRHRARPGHRGRAQAVVPPAVQAAVLPRRVPAGVQRADGCTWSTPTARASSASTRPACGWAACTTSSTA
jgi:hypothetical protein